MLSRFSRRRDAVEDPQLAATQYVIDAMIGNLRQRLGRLEGLAEAKVAAATILAVATDLVREAYLVAYAADRDGTNPDERADEFAQNVARQTEEALAAFDAAHDELARESAAVWQAFGNVVGPNGLDPQTVLDGHSASNLHLFNLIEAKPAAVSSFERSFLDVLRAAMKAAPSTEGVPAWA
jgi:hypothetical protein